MGINCIYCFHHVISMHSKVLESMIVFEKHSCRRSCLKPPLTAPTFRVHWCQPWSCHVSPWSCLQVLRACRTMFSAVCSASRQNMQAVRVRFQGW